MHDTLTPNVLKLEFSRKVIQIRALVALGNSQMKNNPGKKYQLMLVTAAGNITGDYCELYCSDDKTCLCNDLAFDISKVDELANKVLIDAEAELVGIKLVDNAEFIKLTNVEINMNNQLTKLDQLNIYADQIIAFSLVEK